MKNDEEIRQRAWFEEKDELETVIPPPDIVAFNEARSCADLFRLYKKGQLIIKPKFQRGIVWTNKVCLSIVLSSNCQFQVFVSAWISNLKIDL